MAIANISKTLPKKGGIRKIELIESTNFIDAYYDSYSYCFLGFSLKPEAKFCEYSFREGEVLYEESLKMDRAAAVVSHRITIGVDTSHGEMCRSIKEFVDSAPDGLVAILHTNSGDKLLVGYSEKFKTEQSLRLERYTFSSANRSTQIATDQIVPLSEDTSKAQAIYC